MRCGCCLNMVSSDPDGTGREWIPQAAMAGCDYLELPLAEIMQLEEVELKDLKKKLEESGIPCRVCNNFFPGRLRLTGPDRDEHRILEYTSQALSRAAELGASCIVFGSGKAKKIPDGFSYESGYNQIAGLLRRLSPMADAYGICIAIEPLRKKECNIINTFKEGCGLARDVNEKNIRVLADFFHLCEENEPVSNIIRYGKGYLEHVHISNPAGRVFPKKKDGASYEGLFQALKDIGYDKTVSIEAYSRNFVSDLREGLRMVRESW